MTPDQIDTPTVRWESCLNKVLRQRDAGSDSAWHRARAELRRGASPYTEQYAYAHVLPYLDPGTSEQDKTTLIRLLAAVAEFDSIRQFRKSKEFPRRTFGQWCYLVSVARSRARGETYTADAESQDAIGQRLRFIHTLDTEQAILNVTRIMKLASALPGPVPEIDYFDLIRMFLRWGNGLSPESQHVRRKILRDYYSAHAFSTTSPSTSDSTSA